MSRRRRAALLLGLSVVLGGLAASDVTRREHALAQRLGPGVPVLVTAHAVRAGTRLEPSTLARREVPARYAPPDALTAPSEVAGRRTAGPLPAGAYLTPAALGLGAGAAGRGTGPQVGPGERIAEVLATASPGLVGPGRRVDVLVTRASEGGGTGSTTLALEDVEVIDSRPAPEAAGGADQAPGPRVMASLRVTVRQAVYLAAAQSFARELRLLPRSAGDRRHGAQGTSEGSSLR